MQHLNAALNKVIALPEVKRALEQAGATVPGSTPEAFAAHNRSKVARWGGLVRQLKLSVE